VAQGGGVTRIIKSLTCFNKNALKNNKNRLHFLGSTLKPNLQLTSRFYNSYLFAQTGWKNKTLLENSCYTYLQWLEKFAKVKAKTRKSETIRKYFLVLLWFCIVIFFIFSSVPRLNKLWKFKSMADNAKIWINPRCRNLCENLIIQL